MIEIERVSPLTGITNKMYMDFSAEQVEEWNRPAGERRLIQEIFSNLSEDEREFIQTGYTPSDWKEMEKAFAE